MNLSSTSITRLHYAYIMTVGGFVVAAFIILVRKTSSFSSI